MGSSDEDADDDFMSDKFLALAEASEKKQAPQGYSEQRRKYLERAKESNHIPKKAQREEAARRQGLARNLIDLVDDGKDAPHHGKKRKDRDEEGNTLSPQDERSSHNTSAEAAGGNKALRMMLAMGFKPGQSLGKTYDNEAQADASTRQRNTEPIRLDERWLGPKQRSGIGSLPAVSASALAGDIDAADERRRQKEHEPSLEDFRSRTRERHEARHVESLLVPARKTCEELDRTLGMEFSPLWIDTEALAKPQEDLPPHIAHFIEFAFAGLSALQAQESAEDEDKPPSPILQVKALDAQDHPLLEESAMARAEESRRFCLLPSADRLHITLSHLRRTHFYCLFCGQKYENKEDIENNCPGEEEDDH